MSTQMPLMVSESREEVAREIVDYGYSVFEDALEAIRANGDAFSITTARKALDRMRIEWRRANI